MDTNHETVRITLDNRKRLALGKNATSDQYQVTFNEDGSFTAEPLLAISARELALLADPELVAAVRDTTQSSRPWTQIKAELETTTDIPESAELANQRAQDIKPKRPKGEGLAAQREAMRNSRMTDRKAEVSPRLKKTANK